MAVDLNRQWLDYALTELRENPNMDSQTWANKVTEVANGDDFSRVGEFVEALADYAQHQSYVQKQQENEWAGWLVGKHDTDPDGLAEEFPRMREFMFVGAPPSNWGEETYASAETYLAEETPQIKDDAWAESGVEASAADVDGSTAMREIADVIAEIVVAELGETVAEGWLDSDPEWREAVGSTLAKLPPEGQERAVEIVVNALVARALEGDEVVESVLDQVAALNKVQ